MLDINLIRQTPEIVKKDLEKRGDFEKLKWLDDLIRQDNAWREYKQQVEDLRHKRNVITDEIRELKQANNDVSHKLKEVKDIPDKIKKLEQKEEEAKKKIDFYLMRLPNILHASVPIGVDSSQNVEIKKWGKPKKISFELKSHGDIAEALNLADFKRAAKIAGTGFYYLKNELALLDLAIQRFAIDSLMKKGFTLIAPPFMMKREAYEGVTSLADFENVMYKIDGEDLYLIATSEHPMIAMHMDEILEESDLPIKLVGVSSCFRKEIGSHGVDTRGLFRVHQFNKVEQNIICLPEDSWEWHEKLLKNSEELFKKLKIPYRVVNICTGDIGTVAAKKYDIEAWFPRQKSYGEVCSNSNCTDYQARRLGMRYRTKTGIKQVHTLNNTALASSRVMVAILENYQQKDGSVKIPTALVKYMGGIKTITIKK